MRCPRLSEFLKDAPSEKALTWIRAMRGAAYQRHYLKSRLWREVIRRKVLERDDYRCTVCNKWAKHVHHLSYDEATMLGRDLSQMKSVCALHHESSHAGNPPLEFVPLSKRFAEVNEEQRAENRLREKFKSLGGRLSVSSKLSRGWWTCQLRWGFAPEFAAVTDRPNRFFYLAAYHVMKLHKLGRSYHDKAAGARFARQERGPHCAVMSWNDFSPDEVCIKLRESVFPNWLEAVRAVTSRHPFPVTLVNLADGKTLAQSGGYVEPPPEPEKPTKTVIEKWTDCECHTTLSEGDPDWHKYPFGETVIEHNAPSSSPSNPI